MIILIQIWTLNLCLELCLLVFCLSVCALLFQVSKHLCERWNIVQRVSSVDQSQRNALYDQSSSLLKNAIKDVVSEKQLDWDDFIDPVLSLFRTSTNPTTKFTPYCLMFNRKAIMPNEVCFCCLTSYSNQPLMGIVIIRNKTVSSFPHYLSRQYIEVVMGNPHPTHFKWHGYFILYFPWAISNTIAVTACIYPCLCSVSYS